MKYQISCIGKSENKTEKLLIDKYLKRIGPKLKIKELNLRNLIPLQKLRNKGRINKNFSTKFSLVFF